MKALKDQYSLTTIITLWLLVTIPMVLIRFAIMPIIAVDADINPGIIYWILMVIGMVWQFSLSVIVLKLELGTLSKEKIKQRLWLNHPIRGDGSPFKKAYWLTIPIILYAFFFEQFGLFSFIEETIISVFPSLAPKEYTQIQSLVSPEFKGQWLLMVLAIISCLFNYLLGEELFFRGILLPKMNKTFGKWDWAANGILFSTYHLHKIAEIPLFIVGSFFIAFLNKKYRSFWPAVIIHGVEGIPLIVMVAWVIWFF